MPRPHAPPVPPSLGYPGNSSWKVAIETAGVGVLEAAGDSFRAGAPLPGPVRSPRAEEKATLLLFCLSLGSRSAVTSAQSSWSPGPQGHQMSRVSEMTHSQRRMERHQATVSPAGWCVGGGSPPRPGFWLVTPISCLPAKTSSPCLSERSAPPAPDSVKTHCSPGRVSNLRLAVLRRSERLPVQASRSLRPADTQLELTAPPRHLLAACPPPSGLQQLHSGPCGDLLCQRISHPVGRSRSPLQPGALRSEGHAGAP